MAEDARSKPGIFFEHCYEGIWYPNIVLDSSIEALRSFEVRSDDVWVVTFPKSGTHWMIEIVSLILNDGYPGKVNRTLHSSAAEMINMDQTFPRTLDELDTVKMDMTPFLKTIEEAPSPRVILTHLRLNRLPKDLMKKTKAVYLVRNPKDVMTSWYNFLSHMDFMPMTWEENFQQFLAGEMEWGSWPDHVKDFWDIREEENLLFVHYEDILKDPTLGIAAIAEHIGRPLSKEALQRVVESSTMSEMKATYRKMAESGLFYLTKASGLLPFLNKGQVAQWKSRFSVAENEIFDEWYRREMAGTNIPISFE
ncbi:sulfotransferase 1B1-like [Diadema antillarum]|uniref:sulfotransferase 1B1-like n=1 Tax=Diadema antillarum TaxID=105358 RepID=UPI003A8A6D65